MVALEEYRSSSLAAGQRRRKSAGASLTSTPKNRVWDFEITPSGRPCADLDLSWETAIGSVQYTYKIASGRAEFLSRDPLGFKAGPNMYTYVRQNPWTHFDPEGLDDNKQPNPPPPPPPKKPDDKPSATSTSPTSAGSPSAAAKPAAAKPPTATPDFNLPSFSLNPQSKDQQAQQAASAFGLSGSPAASAKSNLSGKPKDLSTSDSQSTFGAFMSGFLDPSAWQNGARNTVNGFVPFWHPFATDPHDSSAIWSQRLGALGITAGTAGIGALGAIARGSSTIGVGWDSGHAFWGVTENGATTMMHSMGRSTTIGASGWSLGKATVSVTGIPALFPRAALTAGIASRNCVTGAAGAVRRALTGF